MTATAPTPSSTPAPLDPAATAIRCPRCGAAPGRRCYDLRGAKAGRTPNATVDRIHRTRYDAWLATPLAAAAAEVVLTRATLTPAHLPEAARPPGDPRLRGDLIRAAAALLARIEALSFPEPPQDAGPSTTAPRAARSVSVDAGHRHGAIQEQGGDVGSRATVSPQSNEPPATHTPGTPRPTEDGTGPYSDCMVCGDTAADCATSRALGLTTDGRCCTACDHPETTP